MSVRSSSLSKPALSNGAFEEVFDVNRFTSNFNIQKFFLKLIQAYIVHL